MTNIDTGFAKTVVTNTTGLFRVPLLPVGQYSLGVEAEKFAQFQQQPIQVNVSQTVRLEISLDLATLRDSVNVVGDAILVDSSSNALGKVVEGREIQDLPLNGRTFTQLGLLQTGVAPLTSGVATAARRLVRVSSQRQIGRSQLLLAIGGTAEAESIRRHRGRTDPEGTAVLLRLLRGLS